MHTQALPSVNDSPNYEALLAEWAPGGAAPTGRATRFAAADGYPLAGTWFVAERPRAVIVLSGGTGIPHRYYARYARYLARRGYAVLTYDYRGIGASRPQALAGFAAQMQDWGRLDQRAAIQQARQEFPQLPWVALGHSVGGQLLAAAIDDTTGTPAAVIQIAVSTGVWWRMPLPIAAYSMFLWYLAVPLLTRLLGYFPSRRLGLGEALPAGVARQWARWCRRGDYCAELAQTEPPVAFDRLRAPAYALGFTDDPIATPRNTADLQTLYAGLRYTKRRVQPREFGLRRIGHLDFFAARMPEALWRLPLDWLDKTLENAIGKTDAAA